MQPGDHIVERVKIKGSGRIQYRVHVVKSVTKTGILTLLRCTDGCSMESKTDRGFAQMVDEGKSKRWRKLDGWALDIIVTNAILDSSDGKVRLIDAPGCTCDSDRGPHGASCPHWNEGRARVEAPQE